MASNLSNYLTLKLLFFSKFPLRKLSGNPITDSTKGGVPRFVLIARLAKIQILNGSEITSRERKDSEIRYVRLVISRLHASPEEIKQHP
ncbi:tubulin-specific chaperone E-like protein, partial [Trifolium pratense]